MAFGRCYICQEESHAVEEHHLILQSAGGRDLPTIPLCASCHSLVHLAALNILSKQKTRQVFSDDNSERAAKVVRFAVLSIQRERESPNFSNPATFHLKTSKGVVSLLHALKAEAGYTNLNTYIESVLIRQITARFPGFRTNREQSKTPVKSET